MLDLARAQRFVDDDRDAAGRDHAEEGGDRFSAAVEEDSDAIVILEARGGQPRGDLGGAVPELGIGDRGTPPRLDHGGVCGPGGPAHVFGLLMPEQDSDGDSLGMAGRWADQLGIAYAVEDITQILAAVGCYHRRNAAIRRVIPEFQDNWRFKVVLPGSRLESDRLNVSYLVVEIPRADGSREVRQVRLPAAEYREIVAATNFKQRVRTMLEYYHADRLHYAVVGTPNRLEYDQGFFVKGGDGLADVKPIAHLYKTQVFELAEYLGV